MRRTQFKMTGMTTAPWSTEEFCYLCGERFVEDVPRSRVFPPQLGDHAGGLLELKTHPACEREFQEDEEYFCTTLLLSQPVLRPFDPRRFEMIPGTDKARLRRVLWKITRGIFSHHFQRFLPAFSAEQHIGIPGPLDGAAGMVSIVRPSSRAQYGDYDFGIPIGKVKHPRLVLDHGLCIYVWETYQFFVWFHDPDCVCEKCSRDGRNMTVAVDPYIT
jgi:hypothetical protein